MGNSSNTKHSIYYPPRGTLGWDQKIVLKFIKDRKIAPFSIGKDDAGPDLEECPICYLNFAGGLNRSKCCKKGICSECFLRIKKPSTSVSCPFCNTPNYDVIFSGPLTEAEKQKEALEQQKVEILQQKIRAEELFRDFREKTRKQQESLPDAALANTLISSNSAESVLENKYFDDDATDDELEIGGSGRVKKKKSDNDHRKEDSGRMSSPPISDKLPVRKHKRQHTQGEIEQKRRREKLKKKSSKEIKNKKSPESHKKTSAFNSISDLQNLEGIDQNQLEELMLKLAISRSIHDTENSPYRRKKEINILYSETSDSESLS
eukprot:TRINITY_DN9168_c0_g1_i1.p1 TRINITY_DN9168_c0_g1~~TRINITY_DN9168_c0_g1_i1.p1  ORF type:complete len:320 (+),score=67.89 TRINITY_DN9168_c0_g1_i1:13-972(+)